MAKVTRIEGLADSKVLRHDDAALIERDEVRLVNTKVLVAHDDYAANEEGVYAYGLKEVKVPKAAVAITAGDKLYWDDTAKNFTNVVGTNTLCGTWLRDHIAGDTEGYAELNQ